MNADDFLASQGVTESSGDPVKIGKEVGLPDGLFQHVIQTESANNADAVSNKGAVGKGQVLPSTARSPGYGIEPFNPKDLAGSARYLKKMIDLSGGNVELGLRRYKQGPNGELNTPSADAYVNSIIKGWKPSADDFLASAGVHQPPSGLAQSPANIGQPLPEHGSAPFPPALLPGNRPQPQQTAGGALNRAANVTVQTLQEAGNDFNQAAADFVHSPLSAKNAGKLALATLGVAGSPFTALTRGFLSDPLSQGLQGTGVLSPEHAAQVQQATELVAGLAVPLAATKAPQFTNALGPLGKWILGVSDTYDQRLQAGKAAVTVSDEIAGLEGRAQAKMTEWLNGVQKMTPQNYQALREEIAHSYENPGLVISPEARNFKQTYLDPVAKETDQMYDQLIKLTGQKDRRVPNYYPRVLVEEEKGKMPFLNPADKPTARGEKVFPTSPSELQKRTTDTVHNFATGETGVYTMDVDTGQALIWKDKNVIGKGNVVKDQLHDSLGGQWQVVPGTMKEIEQHTNLQYVKDPIADLARANKDVYMALSNAKAIERLKTSPEFLTQARKTKNAPEGWRDAKDFNLGTHQLDGWKVSPRLQEVFSDAAREGVVGSQNWLGKLNRTMIGSLFFNPLPHIMNVAWHSWVEKGLVSPGSATGAGVGAVAGALNDPEHPGQGALKGAALGAFGGSLVNSPTEMKALMQGIRAVSTRNADYMRFMKDGAGLMYPSRYTRDFYNNMLKATGTKNDPMMLKAFGFGNVKDMVGAFYKGSGNAMWFANDVIMMQGYLAKEASLARHGMAPGAAEFSAMKEVEKHIPNYRIPGRVGPEMLDMIPGGAEARRGLSKFLQNKTLTSFGRYDYGRMASYSNMMKDLVFQEGANIPNRAQALNQIAALGFGSMVVAPQIFDEFTKAVTGNPNASYQHYGPFTVPWAMYEFMNGKRTWPGLLSTMLPMAPAFKIGAEVYTNRDVFTDKSLHLPDESFAFLMNQMAPHDQYSAIAEGRITPRQWLEGQFGIKDPSAAQVAKTAKYFSRVQAQEKAYQAKKARKQ